MERVKQVKALSEYRLEVVFHDGVRGVVPMEQRLFGPVFEPLRDPAAFARVGVDEFGAVCWPGGADLAPDALYRLVNADAHAA